MLVASVCVFWWKGTVGRELKVIGMRAIEQRGKLAAEKCDLEGRKRGQGCRELTCPVCPASRMLAVVRKGPRVSVGCQSFCDRQVVPQAHGEVLGLSRGHGHIWTFMGFRYFCICGPFLHKQH